MNITYTSLLSIPDANNIAKGMMFSLEYLVYCDFELLKLTSEKIHIGFIGMVLVNEGRISVTLNGVNIIIKKVRLCCLERVISSLTQCFQWIAKDGFS